MPVSYPATMPTSGVTSVDWTPTTSSLISRSPFTFQGQAQSFGGSIRFATISVDNLNRDDAEDWIGFLESLQGTLGTFLFGDPMAATPRGVGGGSPTVVSYNTTTRDILSIENAPISVNSWLKRGDWIQLGSGTNARLYKITSNTNTTSTGTNTSVDIFPKLRINPAAGIPVVINNPKGLFRRTSPTYNYSQFGCNYSLSFDCEEVV